MKFGDVKVTTGDMSQKTTFFQFSDFSLNKSTEGITEPKQDN